MFKRHRRNRKNEAIRNLAQETTLSLTDFIAPLFITDRSNIQEPIEHLPGIYRYSLNRLLHHVEEIHAKGIQAISLFPQIDPQLKSPDGKEAYSPQGIIPQAIRTLKKNFPSLLILSDIALDPYTSHGHDGLCNDQGEILNDETVDILIKQALAHAEAGADILAPSDMMDGRIYRIRQALDQAGFSRVNLLSYCAKYASSFYGPFRSAIQTKLSFGDKKAYQMNPANKREALLEANSDEAEGADFLMIKPALPYLDVISAIRENTNLPVGAYHVSGEYAMIIAASRAGMLDEQQAMIEQLLCIKRAGAQFIYTYAIQHVLQYFQDQFHEGHQASFSKDWKQKLLSSASNKL